MARRREQRTERPLPPPLPPAQRTVGQLVGEAIRAYGAQFWRALALGVPVVVANALAWSARRATAARARAGHRAADLAELRGCRRSRHWRAAPVAVRRSSHTSSASSCSCPFPLLVTIFVLPGLAWLALLGLAVPAALVENLGVRAALVRGYRLARADFVHVLGGLADARSRRRHLAVQPVLRASRVRGEHAARRGRTRVARRLAARLPRQRDPLRRPEGSVRFARRPTKGVRCRPTSC